MAKPLLIFAGPNGSGKSTLAAEILRKYPTIKYICPDNYTQKFSHLESIEERYLAAMDAAKQDRITAISNRIPLAIETVFSSSDKLDFIKFAKRNNYTVIVIFVTTNDPNINIERVKQRVIHGGHNVPQDKIIKRYKNSMGFLPEIVSLADEVIVYDNSEENGTPLLIFQKQSAYFSFNKDKRPAWAEEFLSNLSGSIDIYEVTPQEEEDFR